MGLIILLQSEKNEVENSETGDEDLKRMDDQTPRGKDLKAFFVLGIKYE